MAGGGKIEIHRAGASETQRLWREVSRTNLFPSRKLYRDFFEQLGGSVYTAQGPSLLGYLVIGRWRAGSRLHSLWAVAAGPEAGRALLDAALEDYLPPREPLVTRMLAPEAAPFFAGAGFTPYKTILLLEGDARSAAAPRRAGHGFRVRRYRPPDLEEVLRVDGAAFDPFWKLDAWNLRSISRYCDLNNFLVAEGEEGLEGYCIAGTNRLSGFIQRLAVRPERQGRGLGTDLLRRQAAWARGKGARALLVNTQEENVTAQRLYRKAGFDRSVARRYIYRYERDGD